MQTLNLLIFIAIAMKQTTSVPKRITEKEAITIYYDNNWEPVPLMNSTSLSTPVSSLKSPSLRFGPLPCTCQSLTCGCCVNMNIQLFNFQRHACTNFTYDPYEFSVGMNMLWNEESIFNRSISGKNPPPICIQAPIPYLPTMDQCVRIFNIFTPGRNIHMCMNLETRIERVPVLVLQFDCMRMGADGVALVKPDEEGGLNRPEMENSESTESSSQPPQQAENVFDVVDPDKKKKENETITDHGMKNETVQVPTVVVFIDEQMQLKQNETVSVNGSDVNVSVNGTEIQINLPMENNTIVMEIEVESSPSTESSQNESETISSFSSR